MKKKVLWFPGIVVSAGGVIRHVVRWGRHINKQRFCTIIAYYAPPDSQVDRYVKQSGLKSFNLAAFGKMRYFPIRGVLELSNLLRRERVDILHTLMIQGDIFGVLAAALSRTPVVMSSVEGRLFGDSPARSRAFNLIRRAIYASASRLVAHRFHRIIANSYATREQYLLDIPGSNPQRIDVIYPGLELSQFGDPNSFRAHIRPVRAPHIGFLGDLIPQKGGDLLVEAIPMISSKFPGALFTFGGTGFEAQRLQRRTAEMGIPERVNFPGQISDAVAFLAALDVLVFCSRPGHDGMPAVVLEAMACGTPVVATAVAGVPEVIHEGVSGWLVPPNSPQAIADAVIEVLEDRPEVERRAQTARCRIFADFSIEREVAQLEDLYERLVESCE